MGLVDNMLYFDNFKNSECGITLIELMLAITILGTIGGLGTTIYLQANESFNKAEKRWTVQTDMRSLASFINQSMRNSFDVIINPDNIKSSSDLKDDENYLYVKDNDNNNFGEIRYRDQDNDKIIIGNDKKVYEYSVNFNISSISGSEINDTIDYQITAKDSNYMIESTLYLANMTNQAAIENKSGDVNGVYFKCKKGESGSPSPEISTYCFIATASYGSKTNLPVKILRMFRDLYLNKSSLGKTIINLYYQYSPPIATKISKMPLVSVIVQILLLPIVLIAYLIIIHKVVLMSIIFLFALITAKKRFLKHKGGKLNDIFIR